MENVVTDVVLVMFNWKIRRGRRRGMMGRRRRKNKESRGRLKESDIPSSHLITILTAFRDDPLAMNSNATDS